MFCCNKKLFQSTLILYSVCACACVTWAPADEVVDLSK